MVAAENRQVARARRAAHPEETISILMALAATVGSLAFFWLAPTYQPESHLAWAIPGWISGAYLFTQILFLLVSAR